MLILYYKKFFILSHDLLVESWVLPTQSLNTVVFYTTKSRVNLVNCCLEAENPSAAANMTCAEYYILRISRWPPRWDMVIRIGKKWDFSVLLFLVLARKAYNLKQNFCSLGVVPVFVSFFLPLIVNTNKKINKYYRLVYFFLNDQYFQTTMNYGLPEARSLF